MNEIENASCVSIVLNTFNVLKRERYKLGSNRILGKVYYGLYICTWTVTNNKENYKFVYDCYLKQLGKSFFYSALIDNINNETIFVENENNM